jgi:hypothetical protein
MIRNAFGLAAISRLTLAILSVACLVCLTARAEWSLDSPSWYGPTEKGQSETAEAFDPLDIPVPPVLNGDLNSTGVADVTSATPEPSTLMLLLIALFPAFAMRRTRA